TGQRPIPSGPPPGQKTGTGDLPGAARSLPGRIPKAPTGDLLGARPPPAAAKSSPGSPKVPTGDLPTARPLIGGSGAIQKIPTSDLPVPRPAPIAPSVGHAVPPGSARPAP